MIEDVFPAEFFLLMLGLAVACVVVVLLIYMVKQWRIGRLTSARKDYYRH